MKTYTFRLRPASLYILLAALLLLVIGFGYLYMQKRQYQVQNRRLILQNDSIMSVNIELKNELQNRVSPVDLSDN